MRKKVLSGLLMLFAAVAVWQAAHIVNTQTDVASWQDPDPSIISKVASWQDPDPSKTI